MRNFFKIVSRNIKFTFYILLPLSTSKRFFSPDFKFFLNNFNLFHNDLGRAAYNPDDYKNGQNFTNEMERSCFVEGRLLDRFLKDFRPKKVLELGPGSGFFTRQIFDTPALVEYTSIEVNASFSNYLAEAMSGSHLINSHLNKDYKQIDLSKLTSDTIIAISCLHHMHDRLDFLDKAICEMPNLRLIFFHDPAHYLPRLIKLLIKLPRYLVSNVANSNSAWATHHFITIGEFNSLKKRHPKIAVKFIPELTKKMPLLTESVLLLEKFLRLDRYYPLSRFFITSLAVCITIQR